MGHRIIRASRYLAIAGAVATLAIPAPAEAEPDACHTATAWAERALFVADLPPLPAGWTIELGCGQPDQLGQADRATQTITVWPEQFGDADQLEWTALHETAHAYDHEYLTAASRDRWMSVRELDRPWRHDDRDDNAGWLETPSEDFAQSYAWCRVGERWEWARDQFTGGWVPPTAGQCDLMRELTAEATSAA